MATAKAPPPQVQWVQWVPWNLWNPWKIRFDRLSLLRVVLGSTLLVAAALFGYGGYYLVYDWQRSVDEAEFSALANKIESSAVRAISKQQDALYTVASTFTLIFPNASMWPNAALPINFYDETATALASIAVTRAVYVNPILTPAQLPAFEAFAESWIAASGRRSEFPSLGISPFGTGVYALNESTGEHYHVTTAWSGARRPIIVPFMNIGPLDINSRAVLFDINSERQRGDGVDRALDCAGSGCFVSTGVFESVLYDIPRQATAIYHPVVLRDGEVVALAGSTFNWDTALSTAISDQVSGLWIILQFGTSMNHSFYVERGTVTYCGSSDLHDHKYNHRRHTFLANDFGPPEQRYLVHLFPTTQWENIYHNSLPALLCGLAVGILSLTALAFFFYDYLMGRASRQQDLVLQTKQQFVRHVSHEIRTPTNIVQLGFKLLYSEMFALRATLDPTVVPSYSAMLEQFENWLGITQDVANSADAAISVLNDLINYDKLQMGKLQLEIEPVHIWDALAAAIQPITVQAKYAGVRLEVNYEVTHAALSAEERQVMREHLVLGDGTKLSQVVRNLVSNALKFTPAGGEVVVTAVWVRGLPRVQASQTGRDVDVSQYASCGSLEVLVRDDGAGMSAEQVRGLFVEGRQFHANRLQAGGGSGLGLWISKAIAELHHGTLSASSQGEGLGSVFRLELPLVIQRMKSRAEVVAEDSRSSLTTEHLSGAALASVGGSHSVNNLCPPHHPGLRVRNVLMTDDSAPSRKMVCRLLRAAGYTCFEAGDGQECVDKVLQAREGAHPPIDAVLMDFEMPRMSGPTATGVLRSLGCGVPVIGITGNVMQEDRDMFLSQGAFRVLVKPVDTTELLALLESIVVST